MAETYSWFPEEELLLIADLRQKKYFSTKSEKRPALFCKNSKRQNGTGNLQYEYKENQQFPCRINVLNKSIYLLTTVKGTILLK